MNRDKNKKKSNFTADFNSRKKGIVGSWVGTIQEKCLAPLTKNISAFTKTADFSHKANPSTENFFQEERNQVPVAQII